MPPARASRMADPRFYNNCGPFTLAEVCLKAGIGLPPDVDGRQKISDVASLESAGPTHLAYYAGRSASGPWPQGRAGFCFVPTNFAANEASVNIPCKDPQYAFALSARQFYLRSDLPQWASQEERIDRSAQLDEDVELGPGVVIGPGAEIGRGTRIGPNTTIGRGVAIGRYCDLGSNISVACAYVGDEVLILPGAQIGQPGFGFASGPAGHIKIPQLGRVIVQDRVEIGAATTIDRGALGDTVVGEGTKIDNLVQIGHNTRIGRHCIIVAQSGISGSCELGDFVVLGGQVGVADHAKIGDGARFAARSAATPGEWVGGQDYGGVPGRPMKQWARELAAVSLLAKRRKRDRNG